MKSMVYIIFQFFSSNKNNTTIEYLDNSELMINY